jgi:NTP pyrophosphatase (non-canonical NTP hydrolase)
MATAGEVGELVAEFQWLTEEGSLKLDPDRLERIKRESADVLICLVMLADRLGFDLVEATDQKIQSNAERYPVEKARGNAKKYTEF